MSFLDSVIGKNSDLGDFVSTKNTTGSSYLSGVIGLINNSIDIYSGGLINSNHTQKTSTSTTRVKESANTTNTKKYSPAKTEISCYILNLITNDSVTFDCEPDEITDSNQNNYDPVDIRGRSSPYQGYNASGPRQINFSVTLHADMCRDGLQNTLNKLRALTYPIYSQGALLRPEAFFHIGYMISCRCIVNNVNITFQKPIRDHFYVQAEVSIDLTETPITPFGADEVTNNGNYVYG